MKTRVYTKQKQAGLFGLIRQSLSDIYGSRFLARQLATRDIKSQYRQSFLGILWLFITPLTTGLVWVVLSMTGTVRLSDTGIPYPVYAFSGTLIWSIFKESITALTKETRAAKSVISKINFPKEALILTGVYKIGFNSLPKMLLLVALVFLFGVEYQHSLWLFPLGIIAAIFMGYTIGILITPLSLLYTDINKFIGIGLSFLMYATPVVYAVPKEGIMKTLMEWNPVTPLITVARDLAVGGDLLYLDYGIIVVLTCVPLFLIGLVFYRISIPILVERMNA